MIETKITCDECATDLTYTDNVVDYRLSLISERRQADPNVQVFTCVVRYSDIKRTFNFCNFKCLSKWINHHDQ